MRLMQRRLDTMSVARAQVNELRTLKLQHVAYRHLGWAPSLRTLFVQAWLNIQDAAASAPRPRVTVIWTKAAALSKLHAFVPSPRVVGAYIRALEKIRA